MYLSNLNVTSLLYRLGIVLILIYNLFIASIGYTTLEYLNSKNNYSYISNNSNLFSKDKCMDNLLSRLFPIENDQCYNNDEILLLKLSYKRYFSISKFCFNNNYNNKKCSVDTVV